MVKSSLCDHSDAYILVKGTISVALVPTPAVNQNNSNKKVFFFYYVLFTYCRNELNSTQLDNAKETVVVMPMYNLIEYIDNYAKT